MTEDSFELVTAAEGDLVIVAEHHSDDGKDSYLVLYDPTAIYGHPGAPAYIAEGQAGSAMKRRQARFIRPRCPRPPSEAGRLAGT